jgi:three-Cys-motif partner protein
VVLVRSQGPLTVDATDGLCERPAVLAKDGLPARKIKFHTREKFDRHASYCAVFNNAMRYHWKDNRGYLELFAGSGLAIDDETGEELDGCPLLAASMKEPGFARLAFVERDPALAAALEQRLQARGLGPDVAQVFTGDANDPEVLAAAIAFLPNPGLVFTFIDPEDVNSDWNAIAFIAARTYPRFDFLINLPVNAIERAIGRAHYVPVTRVIGHDRWLVRVQTGEDPGGVIRDEFRKQLESLGFSFVADKEIKIAGSSRNMYDLFFASRNPRALDLWKSIERIEASGQRALDVGL